MGFTTFRDRHVTFSGGKLLFSFRGKSGKQHQIELRDRRLARIVKQCRDEPGEVLFQFHEADGHRHAITSEVVNRYIRDAAGGEFTAKDFRTWNRTVLAMRFLRACEPCQSDRHRKKQVVEAVKAVAARLGNTPAVCRKAYVHPGVLTAYLGSMLEAAEQSREAESDSTEMGLSEDERYLIRFLSSHPGNGVKRRPEVTAPARVADSIDT